VLAALASGLALEATFSAPLGVHAAGVPALDHVFVVIMENHAYGEIIGSPAAPYINSLVPRSGLGTGYTAVAHPSLPNYLALAAGSTFGISSDCNTCWISAPNIGDSLEAAGKTWKAYEESMPSPCFVGDSYPYAQKHNPFIYFNDIRNNPTRCAANIVPYSQLGADLGSTSTTPNYAFITPNLCNDMHDCSVVTGDSWLQQNLPAILNSPAFTSQRSVLFLTWDEDDSTAGNLVPLLVMGPAITAGFRSSLGYNHYSVLHTAEVALGLPTLTASDASAVPMSDFFNPAQSFAGFTSLFGSLTSGAGAFSCAAGQQGAFVLGGDGVPWWKTQNSSGWSTWTLVGGHVVNDPAAACRPGTITLDLYTEGVDASLYHRFWDGTAWNAWENLGGSLTSGPGAASCAAGSAQVFVLGGDGVVWARTLASGTWSGWTRVGGNVMGNPAVVCEPGTANLHLLVEGTDKALYHRFWNGTGWGAWEKLGGSLSSSPAADSCAAGSLDVFVLGGDGVMWRKSLSGGSWSAWMQIGGRWTADPAATCQPATTKVDLYARGDDSALWWQELPA